MDQDLLVVSPTLSRTHCVDTSHQALISSAKVILWFIFDFPGTWTSFRLPEAEVSSRNPCFAALLPGTVFKNFWTLYVSGNWHFWFAENHSVIWCQVWISAQPDLVCLPERSLCFDFRGARLAAGLLNCGLWLQSEIIGRELRRLWHSGILTLSDLIILLLSADHVNSDEMLPSQEYLNE